MREELHMDYYPSKYSVFREKTLFDLEDKTLDFS